ncbi:MAG: DUF86 domain-containing protein [Nitrospirales bacterium]|nr:DUF86 domain-containing protein [Nitrospirales bacterium]
MVIGEAAVHIPDEICARNQEIPWADMYAVRNFVVHEYFGIGERVLWDTIHEDLPGIVEPLRRLLLGGRRIDRGLRQGHPPPFGEEEE